MRLTELDPKFVRHAKGRVYELTDDLGAAHGLVLLCPACHAAAGGRRDVHAVICWLDGRDDPEGEPPARLRYVAIGTGYDDLTLAPAVQVTSDCRARFVVEGGDVRVL